MRFSWRGEVTAVLFMSVGCVEFSFHGLNTGDHGTAPIVSVSPASIDFGEHPAGTVLTAEVTIGNIGEGSLRFRTVTLDNPASFRVLDAPDEQFLEPEESVTFEVEFVANEAKQADATLAIITDDLAQPSWPVPLFGAGLPALPRLEISPDPLDFGPAMVPCNADGTAVLTNVGGGTLEVLDLTSSDPLTFPIAAPDLPFTLAAGEEMPVPAWFVVAESGPALTTLNATWQPIDQTADPVVTEHLLLGEGVYSASRHDEWSVASTAGDLLLAIDRSCSMGDQSADIAAAIEEIVVALETESLSWQLGVVSNADGCFNGGVLDASTPNWQQTLRSAASGTYSDTACDSECLLRTATTSLEAAGPGECNEGFVRAGSVVHVIAITDEPEQSGSSANYWLGRMESALGPSNRLVVSAVVDLSHCGDGVGASYPDAVAATDGVLLDVCNRAWVADVWQISMATLSHVVVFPLSAGPPDESSIEVWVDDQSVTGWEYDSASNSVIFDEMLEDVGSIEINYGLLAQCP